MSDNILESFKYRFEKHLPFWKFVKNLSPNTVLSTLLISTCNKKDKITVLVVPTQDRNHDSASEKLLTLRGNWRNIVPALSLKKRGEVSRSPANERSCEWMMFVEFGTHSKKSIFAIISKPCVYFLKKAKQSFSKSSSTNGHKLRQRKSLTVISGSGCNAVNPSVTRRFLFVTTLRSLKRVYRIMKSGKKKTPPGKNTSVNKAKNSSSSSKKETVAEKSSVDTVVVKTENDTHEPTTATVAHVHVCCECSKTFASAAKLQQHMFVHSDERPFKCLNCEKCFSSKFKLMRHSLIHSSERKYQCTFCERCFHRKDHLKNHLQVHNPNKKIYRCDNCTKEYNSRLSFRKHVAVHAAEAGDLNCKVCGKNFPTTEEILYHLKVHAGSRTVKSPNEKKFQCEFCERRFFTRKDVRRHLVVHTGRRDFLCQHCPQRFGRKDHLVRHMKKSHNDGTSSHQKPAKPSIKMETGFPEILPSDYILPTNDLPPTSPLIMYPPPPLQPKEEFQPSALPLEDHGGSGSTIFMDSSTPTSSPVIQAIHSNDFKALEDIKVERTDELLESFDLNEYLCFGPLPTSPTALQCLPGPSSTPSLPSMTSLMSSVTSTSPTSSSTTPLPRFNQAFQ